jgi:predicted nucleotidyltransferase
MSLDLQSNFRKFHDAIKFDREENKVWLTKKRDMLVKELQKWLKKQGLPSVKAYNQGSYAMGTGVKPIGDRDFDIDVALVFDLNVNDYEPTKVKEWVQDAMNSYASRKVIMKRPCVRVQYRKEGEDHYHVDLAVYGKKFNFWEEQLHIAKGFLGSKDHYKKWEVSKPFKLKDLINNKFSDAEAKAQFKRIICYLKRWKDVNFSANGDGAPTGIALTAIAYEWFQPVLGGWGSTVNDLEALKQLLGKVVNSYQCGLNTKLPVQPYNDLFEKINASYNHKERYKTKIRALYDALVQASNSYNNYTAIQLLKSQFGDDFPA